MMGQVDRMSGKQGRILMFGSGQGGDRTSSNPDTVFNLTTNDPSFSLHL